MKTCKILKSNKSNQQYTKIKCTITKWTYYPRHTAVGLTLKLINVIHHVNSLQRPFILLDLKPSSHGSSQPFDFTHNSNTPLCPAEQQWKTHTAFPVYLHITVCTGAGKSLLTQWDPGAAAPGRESLHNKSWGHPPQTCAKHVQGAELWPLCAEAHVRGFKFFFIIYLFLEGKGGRKEGKHQCVVPAHATPTRDLARSPGMCLDGELTINPLVHRRALNPMSHTSQGSCMSLKCITFMIELL